MLKAGGDYEASLLLFDDIWRDGQVKVDGDIVVAVPAKDVLLVTGSNNLKASRFAPCSPPSSRRSHATS